MATSSAAVSERVFKVEFDREDDGRWIAEIEDLPGVLAYGSSSNEALRKVQALAYRVIADQIEQEEAKLASTVRIVA
jgi:predicted RNase H-like HicB family nuclease